MRDLPYAHVLQTWEWGEFKRRTTGWQPMRLMFKQSERVVALASIGVRSVGPLKIMYAPKGPVFADDDVANWGLVLDRMAQIARQERVIWLKIDPDVILATGTPGESDDTTDDDGEALLTSLKDRGWRFSADQIQFRNTILIDLMRSEDDILAAMSQNTRRKIRVAEREGVQVRAGSAADLPVLYELYRITAARDGFLIRPPSYYELEWRELMEQGLAHALIAEVDGQAVGHVILFHFGRKCWYFTGASSNEHRDKMPNYLLQWEAMRWAKAHGYKT
ncbi:MAG: peptidoglycan bridge formation glycyltransferase FemA/FemB family protein, partial [Anaerolineae bacterium]|nr:peptidoglycan bridge formation glycyltransferase FemA/FemB family protein [Anaerolineae bacterium]